MLNYCQILLFILMMIYSLLWNFFIFNKTVCRINHVFYTCLFHDHSYLLLKTKRKSFRHYFRTYDLDDNDEIQSVFRARAYEIESCLHPHFSVSFCEPQKRWRTVVDATALVIVGVTQPVYRHQQQRSIKRCYHLSLERLQHFRRLQRTLIFYTKWFLKLLF